jgi:hypothetical protein
MVTGYEESAASVAGASVTETSVACGSSVAGAPHAVMINIAIKRKTPNLCLFNISYPFQYFTAGASHPLGTGRLHSS